MYQFFELNKPPAKLTLKQSRDTFSHPIVTNTHTMTAAGGEGFKQTEISTDPVNTFR